MIGALPVWRRWRMPRLHRGWGVLAVAFVAQMCAIGSIAYGYGLLVVPLSAEFNLSRADANGGLMLLIVGMALASPIIGRLLDRVPARSVVVAGAVCFGGGCVAVSQLTALWQIALAALFLAIGGSALGPLTGATLAVRWFGGAQGRALGLIAVASSAGGLVMLPIIAALVEGHGWRGMALRLGLVAGTGIALLALLVIRDRPVEAVTVAATDDRDRPTRRILPLLRNRDLWLIAICFGIVQGVDQALLATIVPYGIGRGFDLMSASLLVSTVSGSAIAGKLMIGVAADRIDRRKLFCGVTLLTACFLILLLFTPSYPVLLMACLLVGAAVGGTTPLWGALIVERFGTRNCGTVLGLLIPLQMPVTIGCLRFIGHVFDRTGGYWIGFATFIVPVALAGVAMLFLRKGTGQAAG